MLSKDITNIFSYLYPALDSASTNPSATQKILHEQESLTIEAITMTITTSAAEMHDSSCMFDDQLMEALLSRQSDPSIEMPFNVDEDIITGSSGPTGSIPISERVDSEEQIMSEIKAAMEQDLRVGGGMAGLGPTTIFVISPGGTMIETSAPYSYGIEIANIPPASHTEDTSIPTGR